MKELNQAIIVVSHGSRNPKASAQFHQLIKSVKEKKKHIRIEGAFFQLAEPTVHSVVAGLSSGGYSHISLVPFFLLHGNHIAHDISELIDELKIKFPQVTFNTGSILYPDKRLEDIVADRVEEVRV